MAKYCTDPVCKCEIDEEKAQQESEYKGEKYKFCSVKCKAEFDQRPEEYVSLGKGPGG